MKHQTTQTETSLESELVVSLYREGDFARTKEYLGDLASYTNEADQLIFIANNLSLIAYDEGDYLEALRVLVRVEPSLNNCTDYSLKAKFHLNRASACEGIGGTENQESYFDIALTEYEGGADYFRKAGHRDEACCLNNIGLLLTKLGRASEAHTYLDRAEAVFSKRSDEDRAYRLAEIDDTRALCCLAENRIEDAVFYASRSVNALVRSGEPRTYIQSKRTLERALRAQEHSLTEWALREAQGEIPATAKILQLPRATIGKRLRENKEYSDLLSLAKFCEKRGMHAKKG